MKNESTGLTLAEVCTIPFVWIGYILYWGIGMPMAGMCIGWIIARDQVMGSTKEGE